MLKKKKRKEKQKLSFFHHWVQGLKKKNEQSFGGLQWPNELVQVFLPY